MSPPQTEYELLFTEAAIDAIAARMEVGKTIMAHLAGCIGVLAAHLGEEQTKALPLADRQRIQAALSWAVAWMENTEHEHDIPNLPADAERVLQSREESPS